MICTSPYLYIFLYSTLPAAGFPEASSVALGLGLKPWGQQPRLPSLDPGTAAEPGQTHWLSDAFFSSPCCPDLWGNTRAPMMLPDDGIHQTPGVGETGVGSSLAPMSCYGSFGPPSKPWGQVSLPETASTPSGYCLSSSEGIF